MKPRLLLSLHDVTPHHFARLVRAEALFRELGVTHATYLVVPRYHGAHAIEAEPRFQAWCRAPRPFVTHWCLHGYHHKEERWHADFSFRNWINRQLLTAGEGEFLSLPQQELNERLDRGCEAFKTCLGECPTGFVAPAWLFNQKLIPLLRKRGFAWTEDHWRIYDVQRHTAINAPVITWASRTFVRRWGSMLLARALVGRWHEQPVLRIAVHPLDFDDRQLVEAIRGVLMTALRHRACGGYNEVLAS
jgi:predicted deacetylase